MATLVRNAGRVRARAGTGVGAGRFAALAAVVILSLVVQSTVLVRLTVLGVIPQVVLVVIISLAHLEGERVGVVMGFFGGVLLDLQLGVATVGLTALVYTLLGYGVGYLREIAPGDSVWRPVLAVAVASVIAELGYAMLSIMLGETWVSLALTAKAAGLVVLYNTLLTPFVFPLVRRVSDRFRPERVYHL